MRPRGRKVRKDGHKTANRKNRAVQRSKINTFKKDSLKYRKQDKTDK